MNTFELSLKDALLFQINEGLSGTGLLLLCKIN